MTISRDQIGIRGELYGIIGAITDPKERRILNTRLLDIGERIRLKQLGAEFGICGERVRQLEWHVARKLLYRYNMKKLSPELYANIADFRQSAGKLTNLQLAKKTLSRYGFEVNRELEASCLHLHYLKQIGLK